MYKCTCGASGCKLWVKFTKTGDELKCAQCAARERGIYVRAMPARAGESWLNVWGALPLTPAPLLAPV